MSVEIWEVQTNPEQEAAANFTFDVSDFDTSCIVSQGVIARKLEEAQEKYMDLIWMTKYWPYLIANNKADQLRAVEQKKHDQAKALSVTILEQELTYARNQQNKVFFEQKIKVLKSLLTNRTIAVLNGEEYFEN